MINNGINFIERLIECGFREECQLGLARSSPRKKSHIPDWHVNYPFKNHWFGVCVDHPDASFVKDGFDGDVIVSLNGILTGHPITIEDRELFSNRRCRYIRFRIGNKIHFQTFSGEIPSSDVVDSFCAASQ